MMAQELANLAITSKNSVENTVELGFLERVENSFALKSPFFPSKIGGKPAWLALTGLPSQIVCTNCTKPLVFLLQIYVPSDDNKSLAYHRAVFLFCCKNGSCYKSNSNECFKAFRCQLPKENLFYSVDSSGLEQNKIFQEFEDRQSKVECDWVKLCKVCGCRGDKTCGKCHQVQYCSKEHQVIDWKSGHKLWCSKDKQNTNQHDLDEGFLFPEYELVTEPESVAEEEIDDGREYGEFVHHNMAQTSNKDWSSLEVESKKMNDLVEDKVFLKFKKIISHEPEQVLRYQRHGNPLWVSKLNTLNESKIPNCSCGAKRTFEFQVLPQLLNHMKVDSLEASIDWGTLIVYTCSQDCIKEGVVYQEEFVWKQDFCETGVPANILSAVCK